jgi:hypothetical protein
LGKWTGARKLGLSGAATSLLRSGPAAPHFINEQATRLATAAVAQFASMATATAQWNGELAWHLISSNILTLHCLERNPMVFHWGNEAAYVNNPLQALEEQPCTRVIHKHTLLLVWHEHALLVIVVRSPNSVPVGSWT